MTERRVVVPREIACYVDDHLSPPADPVVAGIRERTEERFGELAGMNIGEDQGRFLRFLVQVTGATNVVEVGTFTGMSALWLARGLPEGGRLTCLELAEEPIEVARVGWDEAGVADRIEVRIGPALDSLRAMPAQPPIDLAFVDADKEGYAAYVDEILARLAPGGVLAIDNTLWGGRVTDTDVPDDDTSTRALQALNDDLARRDDLDVVILTIGDGVTIVRRR